MQRDHVGANKQFVERHQGFAGTLRAIPRNHLHPQRAADAQNLAADAAQPDDAEGPAKELHAFARRPGAGTDLAIHPRDVAATRQHQRDRMLRDRRIAVTFDCVDSNAVLL
jgi:hypothetical protein